MQEPQQRPCLKQGKRLSILTYTPNLAHPHHHQHMHIHTGRYVHKQTKQMTTRADEELGREELLFRACKNTDLCSHYGSQYSSKYQKTELPNDQLYTTPNHMANGYTTEILEHPCLLLYCCIQ